MSSDPRDEHAPRARPVADAPVQALLEKVEELARRWAFALLRARPLRQMAEVPLRDIAEAAPELCAQMIRALDSDAELARLADGETERREGASRSARLGVLGAVDARDAVEQVEALRGVLWEALLEELDGPSFDRAQARRVSDLSDRLAHVCATVLGAMLSSSAAGVTGAQQVASRVAHEQPIFVSTRSPEGRPAAVLIDERGDSRSPSTAGRAPIHDPVGVDAEALAERPLDAAEARRRSQETPGEARPRSRPWDPVMRVTRGSATPVDERL